MDEELIIQLKEIKERIAAIESTSKYAYINYIREQEYLRALVKHIPGAEKSPAFIIASSQKLDIEKAITHIKRFLSNTVRSKLSNLLMRLLRRN
jgi:hypothetical protein